MIVFLRDTALFPNKLELKCEKLNSLMVILDQIVKKLYLKSMTSLNGFALKQHWDLYCTKVVTLENMLQIWDL